MIKTKFFFVFLALVGLTLYLYSVVFSPDRLWEKCNQAGVMAYGKRDYVEAEKQFLKTLVLVEEYSYDDPRVTLTYNNLAEIFRVQKKYEESEIYIRSGLEIAEKIYGPEHPMVASYLNNLGFNFSVRGMDVEAESNYKRALDIWEKFLERDDPMVIVTRDKYNQLLQKRGQKLIGKSEPAK